MQDHGFDASLDPPPPDAPAIERLGYHLIAAAYIAEEIGDGRLDAILKEARDRAGHLLAMQLMRGES